MKRFLPGGVNTIEVNQNSVENISINPKKTMDKTESVFGIENCSSTE